MFSHYNIQLNIQPTNTYSESVVSIQNPFFWSKCWGDLGQATSFFQLGYLEARQNHFDF